MSESTKVKSIKLAHHFKEDRINITHVEKPYGDYSDPIVKIDVTEFGKDSGQLEIPYENIDELIKALTNAKGVFDSIPHSDVHAELDADIGGGQ